jgi:hypothetical protein
MEFEEEKLAELEYANMSFGEKMMDWLGGIGEWFSGIGTAIGEWFSKGWTMVKQKFSDFGDKIKAWPGKMWTSIKESFAKMGKKIEGLAQTLKAYIQYPFNFEIRLGDYYIPEVNHLGWKGLNKPDDMFMPGEKPPAGYGDRTIMTEEGTFALNNKDSIIAGTDLGQGGGSNGDSTRMANAIEVLVKQNQMLIELVAQGRVIEMDGAAVGKAVGLASVRA